MPPLTYPAIVRLRVTPDEPDPMAAPRTRGSRRPHSDAKVAGVRRLIEDTPLTYGEIEARTGVGRASICRWTRDGGWRRHAFAPRATDTVRSERASARLKARTLAARLFALADRYIRELEETPGVDLDKLGEALELLKMARLALQGRRRRRPQPHLAAHAAETRSYETGAMSQAELGEAEARSYETGAISRAEPGEAEARSYETRAMSRAEPEEAEATREPMRPIAELCVADVDLHRAPRAAIDDFLANRVPPPRPREHALRPRGLTSKRNRHHAWMLGRE